MIVSFEIYCILPVFCQVHRFAKVYVHNYNRERQTNNNVKRIFRKMQVHIHFMTINVSRPTRYIKLSGECCFGLAANSAFFEEGLVNLQQII